MSTCNVWVGQKLADAGARVRGFGRHTLRRDAVPLVERAFGRLSVEPAPVHGYRAKVCMVLHGVRQGHHLHRRISFYFVRTALPPDAQI
jgi:hypothetical protein